MIIFCYSSLNIVKIYSNRLKSISSPIDTISRSLKDFWKVFKGFLEDLEILRQERLIAWVSSFKGTTEMKTIVSCPKSVYCYIYPNLITTKIRDENNNIKSLSLNSSSTLLPQDTIVLTSLVPLKPETQAISRSWVFSWDLYHVYIEYSQIA